MQSDLSPLSLFHRQHAQYGRVILLCFFVILSIREFLLFIHHQGSIEQLLIVPDPDAAHRQCSSTRQSGVS